MKWVYVLVIIALTAISFGCVGNKQAIPNTQTSISPEAASTSAQISETPSGGDDMFGTQSELAAMDTTFGDMNMEISLSNSI